MDRRDTGAERRIPATILLVDDDPKFRDELSHVLIQAGHRVFQAEDGPAASKLLEHLQPAVDLVIVDLVMPGVTGFEVIAAATKIPNRIKIVATTGVLKDCYVEIAKYMGADEAIMKRVPLDATEWLDVIDSVRQAEKVTRVYP